MKAKLDLNKALNAFSERGIKKINDEEFIKELTNNIIRRIEMTEVKTNVSREIPRSWSLGFTIARLAFSLAILIIILTSNLTHTSVPSANEFVWGDEEIASTLDISDTDISDYIVMLEDGNIKTLIKNFLEVEDYESF